MQVLCGPVQYKILLQGRDGGILIIIKQSKSLSISSLPPYHPHLAAHTQVACYVRIGDWNDRAVPLNGIAAGESQSVPFRKLQSLPALKHACADLWALGV